MSDAQNNVTAMPTRADSKPLNQVTKFGELFSNTEFIRRIEEVVPKQLTPGRMLRTMIAVIRQTPKLQECDVLDVAGKMLVCAQAGLEIGTPLGHAYLVPFQNNERVNGKWVKRWVCQVIFGYHGLLDLSYRSGLIMSVNARQVWQDEVKANLFSFQYGTDRHLRHIPQGQQHDDSPEAQAAGRAEDPVWVWAHSSMKDGGDAFEVLPWGEIEAIRDRTQAYKYALLRLEDARKEGKNLPSGYTQAPWVQHRGKMAMKTAFRQLSNWMPRSIEVASLLAIDGAQERRPVDFGPLLDAKDFIGAAADVSEVSGDPGVVHNVRNQDRVTGDTPPDDDGEIPPNDGGETIDQSAGQQTTKTEPKRRRTTSSQEKPADPPPVPETTPPPAPVTETASETEASGFDWPILDEIGEPVGETMHSDPVGWARTFMQRWEKSPNQLGLEEHNADALDEAIKLSEEAASLLAEMQPVEMGTVPMPLERGGKPNTIAYLRDLKNDMAALTPEDFTQWVDLQRAVIMGAAQSTKQLAIKAIVQRAKELGIPPPDGSSFQAAPATAAATAAPTAAPAASASAPATASGQSKDDKLAQSFLEHLDTLNTEPEVNAYSGTGAVRTVLDRWRAEDPPRYNSVVSAFHQRNIDIRAKAGASTGR